MMKRPLLIGTAIACLALPDSPPARSEASPQEAASQFGRGVAGIGDLDGDSIPDLAISDPLAGGTGRIYLHSGKTGTLIRTLKYGVEKFGAVFTGAGDLDGDGRPDVLATAKPTEEGFKTILGAFSGATGKLIREFPLDSRFLKPLSRLSEFVDFDRDGTRDFLASEGSSTEPGTLLVVSGKTGLPLLRIEGTRPGEILGLSFAAAGDVDKDGVTDVASVGSPGDDGTACPVFVRVYSGKTGKTALTVEGMKAPMMDFHYIFPPVIASPGDLDGDGAADIVVGAPNQPKGTQNGVGMVRATSGAKGTEIWTNQGSLKDAFGLAVVVVDDADGDGIRDLAATGGLDDDPTVMAKRSRIEVLSGKSGKPIRTIHTPEAGEIFSLNQNLANVGDLDGDGKAEIAKQTYVVKPQAGSPEVLRVRVFSGKDGHLVLTLTPPK